MPSIFPLSPSTRNALPSGNAKKATSLTHTQWGEAGGSGSMVPAGSGGSCARAVAPLTAAARASAAQAHARPRGWITSLRRKVPCSEVLTELDAAGAGLIEEQPPPAGDLDRKSTRLNSSHGYISYAVFCLKKQRSARCSAALYTLLLSISS